MIVVEIIKRNYIVLLMLLLQLMFYVYYINSSAANIIFQDQFHFIQFVDKYFNSSLSFGDLWRGHLEHRTLGYNIIFLLNAILFHLNTMYEMYMGAIILFLTSILLYYYYRKNLDYDNDLFVLVSFPLVFYIVFGLNQWENIVLSLGLAIMIKMLFFLIVFIFIDMLICNEKFHNKLAFLYSLSLFIAVLLFGGGYSPALVGSIIVTLFCKIIINKTANKKDLKVFLLIIIASSIALSIYYYHIYYNNMIMDNLSIIKRLDIVLDNPMGAVKFFLLSLSASLFGVDLLNNYMSQNLYIFIGIIIIFIYFYSIILFILSEMYRKTYFPLMLMFYSLIILGMILIARYYCGVTYGMSSRYVTDTQYGIIGAIWIIFYFFANKKEILILNKEKKESRYYKKKAILISILILVIIGVSITNIIEWKISPFRKANFLKMRAIALDTDNITDNDIRMYQYNKDLVIDGLKILKKNKLNVFYDFKVGYKLDDAILVSGWYEKEGSFRWTGKQANTIIKSGQQGKLIINGYLPDVYKSNELKIFINDNLIYDTLLSSGQFNLQNDLDDKNKIITIRMELGSSFVPAQLGINNDQRELGIIINNIELY